jgi:hypothetical protein
MDKCYACGESRWDWLKQCSRCRQWSCGSHAEWHIYKVQGEQVGEEVICHECERMGHKPLNLADEVRAYFAEIEWKYQRAKKAKRKQQSAARKRNRH